MKKLLYLALFAMTIMSCEEEDINVANRVSFESDNIDVVVPGGSVNFERVINVYTTTVSNSDRQFQVVVDEEGTTLDAGGYTIPSTVTIPANTNHGQLVALFSDEGISFEAKTVAIELVSEDDTFTGNATLSVTELCEDTVVTLAITTDDYPEETTWELYDLSGTPTVIYSGGPYDGEANTTLEFQFCLADGPYGIYVADSYGDGIPNGGFVISANGGTLVSGGVAGEGSSATFTVN